jgi:hypothetical protein
MPLCVNCGVELDDEMHVCPLCGKNPGNHSEQANLPSATPSGIIQLHRKENRKNLWEIGGIIAFSGIVVCTLVDLIMNKGMRWSLYADVSLLAVWVILTLFMFAFKRRWILVPGLLGTILAMLFIIDLGANGLNWFFPVGLPITIAAFITAGIVAIIHRVAHFKGFDIMAAALIVISGFCILTEITLDKYLHDFVDLRWSLIAAVSIFAVALVLFFYHFRMKKGKQLDSFFHI